MSVIKLTDKNYDEVVLKSDKKVLIDFYATWCGPCKMVSPLVDEISEENPQIVVCKVDVDEEMELARQFGIMSIPTLVVMNDGKLVKKEVGYRPKNEILEMLK